MSSLPAPTDRHAPSPSRLSGEKVGSSTFPIRPRSLPTPSFSLRRQVAALVYLRSASRADRRVALQQAERSWRKILFLFFFLSSRSQILLHQLRCSPQPGRLGAAALMTGSWCGRVVSMFFSMFNVVLNCTTISENYPHQRDIALG